MDPIFKYVGSLDNGADDGDETAMAMDYCRAVYNSIEDYPQVTNSVRRALLCYDVGEDHKKGLRLGTTDFWADLSERDLAKAGLICELILYICQHCSGFCRNSGAWVFIGDIYEKMISDGLTNKTAALVMHVA